MSRKGQASVSVSNVLTEQDWLDLCKRHVNVDTRRLLWVLSNFPWKKEFEATLHVQGGLTIVDVYSEWAGPCTAMTGALKKIKLEAKEIYVTY